MLVSVLVPLFWEIPYRGYIGFLIEGPLVLTMAHVGVSKNQAP